MENNFYAMLSRMKYINRWALMRNTRNENLCEHTLEVAYIVHCLVLISNQRLGKKLNAGDAVLAALYHDVPEILTGDLPTPVKYYNNSITTAFKDVEAAAVSKLNDMLPEDFRESYKPLLSGVGGEIGLLIKAADKLSALIKCTEELNVGNREFTEAETATLNSIKAMNCTEANIFIKEFLPAYRLTLDEQARPNL